MILGHPDLVKNDFFRQMCAGSSSPPAGQTAIRFCHRSAKEFAATQNRDCARYRCAFPLRLLRRPLQARLPGACTKKAAFLRNAAIHRCGETGIRTLGTVTRSPHFECGPIDHSGISPKAFLLLGRKYTIYSIILIWKIHFFLSTCPPPPCRHAYPLQNALQGRLACSHPPCKHTCGVACPFDFVAALQKDLRRRKKNGQSHKRPAALIAEREALEPVLSQNIT